MKNPFWRWGMVPHILKFDLKMKLTVLFAVVSFFQLQAFTSYGQKAKVSLDTEAVPLKTVLKEIEKQTDYRFFYNLEDIDTGRQVTLKMERQPLDVVLKTLFKDSAVDYSIVEKQIVLTVKKALSPNHKAADDLQQHWVSGSVTDAGTLPLPGVTVLVKGTSRGTATGVDGTYRVEASPQGVLVFSMLGYNTLEVPVNGRDVINIQMAEAVTELGEVTLNAGYYTVKERERTGSISRISSKEIEKQPVSNPLAALQGQMAGVLITQSTGVPGGGFTIRVRGRNSIAGGNEPLYIIDGVPFSSDPLNATFSNPIIGRGNPLENINNADIGSIEILKDADATAIYGSRGANGVVLITTKKGKTGKTTLDLKAETGIAEVSNTLPMLDTRDYLLMRNEAFANDGITPTISNAPDLVLWDQDRYTDWQEKLYGKTAFIRQVQIGMNGGGEQTRFRLGGNYRNEGSVFNGYFGYEKAGAHLALNHRTSDDRLSLSLSVSYQSLNNDQPLTDPTLSALFASPNAPEIYDKEGMLNWEESTFSNPFALMLKHYKEQATTLYTNAVVQYTITRDIALKVNLGYNHNRSDQKGITPMASLNPSFYDSGEAWFGEAENKSWIIEPQLSYRNLFGKSDLNVLAGVTFQENRRTGREFYARGFSNDALIENITAASSVNVQNFLQTEYRYHALFGRVNYNYDNRYILNLTGRRDGSSRFGPGKQWANFGALGAAWLFSNENFLRDTGLLSFGKLRASYGTTGNDQIADYGYLDSWLAAYYTYGGESGMYPARLYNPDYGWEVNKKLEVALDLGFINDRILFNLAYYRNRSSSQLVGQPLPYTTGFGSIQNNLEAEVQNTGWELEVHATGFESPRFSWHTDILLTLPRNKLLAFPNLEQSVYANTYVVGQPLHIVKTYHSLGVDRQTGLYSFEDVNGDGIISAPSDQQTIKRLGQDFYGSFRNRFRLGGWELDFLFDFVKQTGRSYNYSIGSAPGFMRNQPIWVMDRWQDEGDRAGIQRFSQVGTASQAYTLLRSSDSSITDASFVKLRNISLSYTLPQGWLNRTPFKSLGFTLQGQNLFTITGYKGLDPETQTNNVLPPLRIVMGGVNVSF